MMEAREMAVRWMPGFRHGSGRPSWMHPGDVVALVEEVPGVWPREMMKEVAWLHDIIEDGVRESGEGVTAETLAEEGFSEEVIEGVVFLTTEKGKDLAYFAGLMASPAAIRVVKCLDRIANLREGAPTFKAERWARFTKETREFIVPMAESVGGEAGAWLKTELEAAMAGLLV